MKRTQVSRSMTLTVSCIVVAVASWGLLAWIFAIGASGGNKIMGSVLLGGLGLVALLGAALGSKKAPCPECGAKIYPDPDREIICDTCRAAVLQRGDEVERLEPEHVASERCFGLPLRAGVTFPQLCASCGALATRTVPVEYHLSFAWKAFITVTAAAAGDLAYADQKVNAKVPVCDAHDDGGEIKDLHKEDVLLCVRSWGFAKAYREVNEGAQVTIVR
ncbi:MAG: hypothetical protein HOV80_21270 [Polyangiaceae bacterium]|nr:hypothetical protein [Polyangiaceae bacterium]